MNLLAAAWRFLASNRRLFALLFLGLLAGGNLRAQSPSTAEPGVDFPSLVASRVLFAEEKSSIGPKGRVQAPVVEDMVQRLLLALTGRHSVTEAWLSLLSPTEDVVGLKVSAAGRGLSGTRLETLLAVVRGLRQAGFSRDRIIVWDRERADLLAAGLRPDHPDYTLRWIDEKDGYDPESSTTSPLLGRLIFGDRQFVVRDQQNWTSGALSGQQFSSKSHFAKVLTQEVTKVIHLPALQDSFLTGLHGALAGMTLPNMDNWRRFTGPPAFGDPHLAEIYALPQISSKVVLTIMDGLFLQYAGGPLPSPAETVENYTLFMSYDPVALDAVARRFLTEERKLRRLPPLLPMTGFLESAEAMGLGLADEKKIQLIEVPRRGISSGSHF